MYSTSLPPSLKSFTLLNGQVRPATPPQNQRFSGYSANSVHMQQPLQHGDKLQFSGKRLEELKRQRKEKEAAEASQKILDAYVQVEMNNFIFGKLEANSSDKEDAGPAPDLKKLERAAYTALKNNPNYPTNALIDDVMEDDGEGHPIKWTLLHKAIFHGASSIVNLLLDERKADVLIRDSDDITPLDTAKALANNSDGFYSDEQAEVHQHIYNRVKAEHDKQEAEIDKINKDHQAELKAKAEAAEAAEKAKNKPKKLSPAVRKAMQKEKKDREARLKAEAEKEQELKDRFNNLDVLEPEQEPDKEDTEGVWETPKKSQSIASSPLEERKSQAASPDITRGSSHHQRTSTNSSKDTQAGKKKRENSSATSATAHSPTVTRPSPASEKPAPMPVNPWKKPWLESRSKTEPSIEAGEDAPKQSIDRTSTAPVASSSKLPSHPESLEEPPIRPLETMRDLSRTLPNLRTSGLASPSTFSFTTSSSTSSLADQSKIRKLKEQRDEQRLLLEQGSRHARDMQNAIIWKDWHFNNLLRDFHQLRQQFITLQQQMAPPPMPMFQHQPFVPLSEQQRTQNLQEQEHVMQNMEHMQGLIQKLKDTTESQALEEMKKDSEQPLAFEPDPSGTGYVIAKGPRKGEWVKDIPTGPLKPFVDQGKKFDSKETE